MLKARMADSVDVRTLSVRLSRRMLHLLLEGTFDDLVELPPVKPDPAAFRAVIDLDPLTFGHDKIDAGADGTFHNSILLSWYFVLLRVFCFGCGQFSHAYFAICFSTCSSLRNSSP